MKINQIILNENDIEDLIKSSRFKKEFPDTKLYHGVGKNTDSYKIGTIKFRYRDSPTDSTPIAHNLANKLSEEKFGVPIRNLFFTTKNSGLAEILYGNVVSVVPSDDFRMFASTTIKDFTIDNKFQVNEMVTVSLNAILDSPSDREAMNEMENHQSTINGKLAQKKKEIKTFEQLYDLIRSIVEEIMLKEFDNDKEFANTTINEILESMKPYEKMVIENCHSYIDNVIEIKNPDDFKKLHKNTEIMILAEKFYVMPS